jgi:hypothetical protein
LKLFCVELLFSLCVELLFSFAFKSNLRPYSVAEDGNLADAGLSSLTLQPGAMAAEVGLIWGV